MDVLSYVRRKSFLAFYWNVAIAPNNARFYSKFFKRQSCRLGEVELDRLKYGFVDTYEEYSTSSQEFAEEFSEAEDVWKMLME